MIELSFQTPSHPINGFWRIRIVAQRQVKLHPFLVMQYFIPRFELMFSIPSYVVASEGAVTGEIEAYVTSDADVIGNMTVQLWAKYPANASDEHYKKVGQPILYDYVRMTLSFYIVLI